MANTADTTESVTEAAASADSPSLLSSSAQGASYLILLQILSRFLTFTVNLLLLRYIHPELLGITAQLEIYQTSVLYFARESLRIAIQRQSDEAEETTEIGRAKKGSHVGHKDGGGVVGNTPAGRSQAVVNLAYVSIGLGVPFAVALAALYLRSQAGEPVVLARAWLHESVYVYGLAALVELLTEPCFVIVQQKMLYRIRAAAEATATILRGLITCGLTILAAREGTEFGALPFAVGHLSYALILGVIYYWQVSGVSRSSGFSLWCRQIASSDPAQYVLSSFSRPLLSVGASLFAQSAIKHVLTQGDALLIGTLSTIHDSGIYGMASNYGGLIARVILQPIEESCRNLFSKLLSTNGPSEKPHSAALHAARSILQDIIRVYLTLSIIVATFGPIVAPLLLRLVVGPRWIESGAGAALSTYCYYIPVLALNGVTEAFIASVATPADLQEQSLWMLAFSAGFAVSGYVFLRVLQWGAQGLVWANVANMLLRVIWSGRFIARYLSSSSPPSTCSSSEGRSSNGAPIQWAQILPSGTSIASGVATSAILARMNQGGYLSRGAIMDLVTVAQVAVPFLLLLAFLERNFLRHCYHRMRPQEKTQEKEKEKKEI
ncbi:MAG: Oligosaccharide translocation protein rft1 [Thelocarpon superellum]|nr:MAG: Oligosaccharide translocation protein rft1 [Thelocarpon superellum]